MKKLILIFALISVLSIVLQNCASMGDPKKMACKKGCESTYDSCRSDLKAGDTAGALKCEAEKTACLKGCDEM